ncbi:hypothetical protein NIB75_01760 [Bacteroides uniformis]|nr:hypothetical protein [Bacteroides uniformis]
MIWIIFLFLCLISITEVFSAASTLTYKSGDHWGPITQHSILLDGRRRHCSTGTQHPL